MKDNILFFVCGVSVTLCICLFIYIFVLRDSSNKPKELQNIDNVQIINNKDKSIRNCEAKGIFYLTVKNNRNYPYYVYVNNDLICEVERNSESNKIEVKAGFAKVELKQASGYLLEPRIFTREYKDVKPCEYVVFNLHY